MTRLLTAAEVAERLNVPESQVYNLHRTERLPSIRIGKYVRFDERDLARWLAGQKGGAPRA